MSIQAQSADGMMHEFPDGTDPSVVDRAMKSYAAQKFAPPPAQSKQDSTAMDVGKSLLSGIARGVGQMADMVSPAAGWQLAAKTFYPDVQTPIGGQSQAMDEAVNKIAGGYHTPQTLGGQRAETLGDFIPGAVAGPEGVIPKIASVVGPAVGAQTAGEYTNNSPTAKIGGAVLGGFGAGGLSRAKAIAGELKSMAPSKLAIKEASQADYAKALADDGPVIAKPAITRMSSDIRLAVQDVGHMPEFQPNAAKALRAIDKYANQRMSLKDLDQLSRGLSFASQEPTQEAKLASVMRDKVNDFLDDLQPIDVVGGDIKSAQESVETLFKARGGWARYRKADILDRAMAIADTRGKASSSMDVSQAIRQQFQRIATNAKTMNKFNPDEQAAIRAVAEGSPTERTLRLLGKLAPDNKWSLLSEGAGIVYGLAHGNLPMAGTAAALLGTGAASKYASSAMTRKAALYANELVRGGQPVADAAKAAKARRVADLLKQSAPTAIGSIGLATESGW